MKPSPQSVNVEVKELSVWDETLLSVWDETLAESVWCPCDIAAWVYMMHVSMQLSMPHTLCHVMQACTCIRVRNIMHSLRLIYYNYHGKVGLRPPTRDSDMSVNSSRHMALHCVFQPGNRVHLCNCLHN